jgi:hypothetical protein
MASTRPVGRWVAHFCFNFSSLFKANFGYFFIFSLLDVEASDDSLELKHLFDTNSSIISGLRIF